MGTLSCLTELSVCMCVFVYLGFVYVRTREGWCKRWKKPAMCGNKRQSDSVSRGVMHFLFLRGHRSGGGGVVTPAG